MKHAKLASVLVLGTVALSGCVDTAERSLGPAGGVTLAKQSAPTGINVALNTPATAAIREDLARYGRVTGEIAELNVVLLRAESDLLEAISSLPYVEAASFDAERHAIPVTTHAVSDFSGGLSTWNLDAVNVTDLGAGRTAAFDGRGVYVGVLDTGLIRTWRSYFPAERIAAQYAKSFTGSALDGGNVAEQPNKWEQDTNSHGTHVTSTIIGYNLRGSPINGVAPLATVIPVKVLNQNGSGWSSQIAQGIVYLADLKTSALGGAPMVINMSLGGGSLEVVERMAIEYAVRRGVIIVASAGNRGTAGMGYPGAFQPVISVAAAGWAREFTANAWWRVLDVPESPADELFVAGFSSRALAGQDLDVTAPGQSVVGPYQVSSDNTLTYYYLSGTSMAAPHVAGIVALMAQKNPALTAPQAEAILEGAAFAVPGFGPRAAGHGFVTADAALALVP